MPSRQPTLGRLNTAAGCLNIRPHYSLHVTGLTKPGQNPHKLLSMRFAKAIQREQRLVPCAAWAARITCGSPYRQGGGMQFSRL